MIINEPLIKSIIAPLSNGFSSGVIDACGFNQRFLNFDYGNKTTIALSELGIDVKNAFNYDRTQGSDEYALDLPLLRISI